ncbi:MAG: ribonuclease toxin immunity protein CdiI [Romboutsia sp.]
MYNDCMYVNNILDKKKLLEYYYNYKKFTKGEHLLKTLERHSNFQGDAISQEVRCCFATEFYDWEEDYFGESGVAYYFDYPAVEKDCIVILTYEEFYKYLSDVCKKYVENNEEQKVVIYEYLNKIKINLGL